MPDSTAPSRTEHPPRWRAIAIGVLLAPPLFYFSHYSNLITQSFPAGGQSLQMNSVFLLSVAVALAGAMGAIWRPLRLHRAELLVIYVMSTVTVAIGGNGGLASLIPTLPARHYYATAENDWAKLFADVPPWLTVNAPRAVEDFYEATGTIWSLETLQAWAAPLGFWLLFVALLVMGTFALSNLVAEQWINRERLSFPLVQVPLAMVQAGDYSRFWHSRLVWIGVGISATLESMNYINWLHPVFPRVWLKARPVAQAVTAMPMAAIRPLYASFYPWMIGLAILLSSETSLSCWLFYWVGKAQKVLCAALGIGGTGGDYGITQLPLIPQQGTGALLALMIVSVVVAWPNLRKSLRSGQPEGAQMISSRASIIILAVAFVALVSMTSASGVPVIVAVAFFIFRWLMALAWGRVTAETGSGWTWHASGGNIQAMVSRCVGTASLAPRALPMLAMVRSVDWYPDSRAPQLLGAFKLSQAAGIPRKQLRDALFIIIGVAIIWCTWSMLHIFYTHGAAMAKTRPWLATQGRMPWQELESWLRLPRGPDWWQVGGYLYGGAMTVVLTVARWRITGWPLHPIGYALANTQSMDYMWTPFLIAWVIKSTVIRYGGFRVYRRLVPLVIGVIIGDFVSGGLWGLYGAVIGQQMYFFFPH